MRCSDRSTASHKSAVPHGDGKQIFQQCRVSAQVIEKLRDLRIILDKNVIIDYFKLKKRREENLSGPDVIIKSVNEDRKLFSMVEHPKKVRKKNEEQTEPLNFVEVLISDDVSHGDDVPRTEDCAKISQDYTGSIITFEEIMLKNEYQCDLENITTNDDNAQDINFQNSEDVLSSTGLSILKVVDEMKQFDNLFNVDNYDSNHDDVSSDLRDPLESDSQAVIPMISISTSDNFLTNNTISHLPVMDVDIQKEFAEPTSWNVNNYDVDDDHRESGDALLNKMQMYCEQCDEILKNPKIRGNVKICPKCEIKLQMRCAKCGRSFSDLKNLKRHINEVCYPNEYSYCSFCAYRSSRKRNLLYHMYQNHCDTSEILQFATVSENEAYTEERFTHYCADCDEAFSPTRGNYVRYCLRCNTKIIYKCTKCGKFFAKTNDMRKHSSSVCYPKQYSKCNICGYMTAKKCNILRHLIFVHCKSASCQDVV